MEAFPVGKHEVEVIEQADQDDECADSADGDGSEADLGCSDGNIEGLGCDDVAARSIVVEKPPGGTGDPKSLVEQRHLRSVDCGDGLSRP